MYFAIISWNPELYVDLMYGGMVLQSCFEKNPYVRRGFSDKSLDVHQM